MMKQSLLILLMLGMLLSCTRTDVLSINELVIAPIIVDEQTTQVVDRLDILAKTGFNSIVFIGSDNTQWTDLTLQAHGRGLAAFFMVDAIESAKVEDYILSSGLDAKIDGIWLSQGNSFSSADIKKIDASLRKMKAQIKDRKSLGYLAIQSNEASTVSLFENGKLVSGVMYYDHTAAGLLSLFLNYGTAESEPQDFGSHIAKMYNWRNFYTKTGNLLIPMTLNFSYAFEHPMVFSLALGLMSSVSGPIYLPIALNASDESSYKEDLQILKKFIELRKNYESLFDGKQTNLAYNNGAYIDLKEKGRERILVVLNLTASQISYRLPYLGAIKMNNVRLTNLEDGRTMQVEKGNLSLQLSPLSVEFWKIEKS